MRSMLVALALSASPLAAQPSLPDQIGSTSALASAAQTISGMAGDSLLIRDLLGKPLVGSGGEQVGTVEDFAVVPGSNLVAAIVRTPDGSTLAVPFQAVKLGSAAQKAPMQVPFAASDVRGMSALSSLADRLGR